MRIYANKDFLVITELKIKYDDLPVYNHTPVSYTHLTLPTKRIV